MSVYITYTYIQSQRQVWQRQAWRESTLSSTWLLRLGT